MNLKPCPFCGEEYIEVPDFAMSNVYGSHWWKVECSCGASGPDGASLADVIERWNTRKVTE